MDPPPVDDALAAAYARDGVVCVRSALDAREVAAAARAIDAVLASPGPLTQVASGADDPSGGSGRGRRGRRQVPLTGPRGS